MPYECRIEKHSQSPAGHELITFIVTYPRMVLAENNTHKMVAKSAASSRAIPNERLIEKLLSDPVYPVWWGKNQPGMSAHEEIEDIAAAREWWIRGRDLMIEWSREGAALGLHKQICNRGLEPWMWVTNILTATLPAFANFFWLRNSEFAQPEIAEIAKMMEEAYIVSIPDQLKQGEWHLPLIRQEEKPRYWTSNDRQVLLKYSAARCARVSLLNHDGTFSPEKDTGLADSLVTNGHWSPMEHQGKCDDSSEGSGSFGPGWMQYRKTFPNEFIQDLERLHI